jgi:Ni/Co efflux regulator RcnB
MMKRAQNKEHDMKMTRIVCAVAAASLACSGIAFAQEPPNDGRNAAADRLRENAQSAQHDRRPDTRNNDRGNNRGNDRRDNRPDQRAGAGPDHSFYRGGRLPEQYRGRQYVVDDWRGHHLSAPPRGYHWVQTGGDYVLAAVATGVIASILLNSR